MVPYYYCPFASQGMVAGAPQQMMPMAAPGQAQVPLFQAPGIYVPPGTGGMMPATGMVPEYDMDMMDIAPLTASSSDPPPVLSNNPATATLTLFKELTGYPNYGNPSGNADILYTGNRGVWTFDIPAFLFIPGNLRAQLIIRAVLDDHSNVPVSRYSATISFNGNIVHRGALSLVHGSPVGQRFNNWRSLTFNVTNLRRNNRVVIVNTSTAGENDWIALDWMELRLVPR
jgi:hypothetical protein